MIDTIPIWVSALAFLLLQTGVVLYLGLPLWWHKRAGGKLEREARRQFRAATATVALVLFLLLDPLGILRLLGIDPMMTLVGIIVGIVDWLRSL